MLSPQKTCTSLRASIRSMLELAIVYPNSKYLTLS